MRDGQAGLGHPSWRGGGGRGCGQACGVSAKRDLNALRLDDASANRYIYPKPYSIYFVGTITLNSRNIGFELLWSDQPLPSQ